MRTFDFLLLFLVVGFSAHGQENKFNISGEVVEKNYKPLPYAQLSLMNIKDSTLIDGAISKEDGTFIVDNVAAGKYIISANFLGYESVFKEIQILNQDIDLETIRLIETNLDLDEVVIKGRRKLITRELDKTVLDIQNSVFKDGENSYRLLNILPGVQVDGLGNIVFRGQERVIIYINGRKLELDGNQAMSYLKAIPSESIEKIELSSIPSAQYDAEDTGAIINIIFKKEYTYGFSGSINTSYTQHRFANYNSGALLNYRKGKFNFQTNYTYLTGSNFSDNIEDQQNANLVFTQEENYREDYGMHIVKIGVDFNISDNHTLGANYELTKFNVDTFGDATTAFKETLMSSSPDSTSRTKNLKNLSRDQNSFDIFYRIKLDSIGSILDAGYSYVDYDNKDDSDIVSEFFQGNSDIPSQQPQNLFIDAPLKIAINTYNLDLKWFFDENSNLEIGGKYSFSLTNNRITYFNGFEPNRVINNNRSDEFRYDEKITGLYGSYMKKFEKFSYKVGLRTERTDYLGESKTTEIDITRNKWDFFPSVFAQQELGENSSINLSYGRRITRPSFQLLNPFEDVEDPYFLNKGNPELIPYYSDNYELNYNLKSKYSFTFAYSSTLDIINNVYLTEGEQVISTYENINDQRDYLISSSIPINVTNWYEISTYGNLRYRIIYINDESNRQFDIISPYVYISNKFNFEKSGVSFEINGRYLGKSFFSIYELRPQGSIDLNLKKVFLEGKLGIWINSNDPFNLKRIRIDIPEQNFTRNIQNFLPTRTISFGIYYNFSQGEKDTNRENVDPANQDELQRIEN